MSERASLVPLSHSLEAGTAGQTANAAGNRWDNGGTPSLKSLALKVLQRDKGRDTAGTAEARACPTVDKAVGQDQASVPAKTQALLMRDGRRLWRWRADNLPQTVSDSTHALADEARTFGCVLAGDGLDLIVVEPWLSTLPDSVRDNLAADAGAVIALLRGESRVRTDTVHRDV